MWRKILVVTVSGSHLVLALALHSGILTQQVWLKTLGDAKCGGLPAFSALTGCDVLSNFAIRREGKMYRLDSIGCI